MKRTAALLLSMLVCWLTAAAALGQASLPPLSIPNGQRVNTDLWRGAQPSKEQLIMLKNQGVKTVIDLRLPGPGARWEADEAIRLGLNYFHIPLGFDSPSEAEVNQFLALVDTPGLKPVFVHCRQGADRTGTLVAIYRILKDGWTFKEAYSEMRQHHFKPPLILLKNTVKKYSQR